MDEPPFYEPVTVTVDEAKRLSGLGTTTIYALLGEGRLQSTTIGRRRLISYASLKTLLTGSTRDTA